MDQLTESARQWIKYKNSLPYVPFDGNTNTKTTPFRLTIQDVDIVLPKVNVILITPYIQVGGT